MEPHQLKPGEKVAVPAAWLAGREKENERRKLIGEWREHLSTKQKEAVEANPFENFRSGMPVELIRNLTPGERDELMAAEQGAYARHRPLAKERDEQRRAYVAAGGSAEAFDDQWEDYGEQIHIASKAEANLERARGSSPY